MLEQVFFDLVERVDNVVSSKLGDEALKDIAREYDLNHVAYLGINIPHTNDPAYILTTYSDSWVHRYVSEDYVSLDPIIQVGLRGILPLDWRDVQSISKPVENFFGESREFGVGNQGLSIPIRGVHGETAMFSINASRPDSEWDADKRQLMRDFQVLGYHFHNRVLEQLGVLPEDIGLTARELECLRWAANGKSAFVTSNILNISERTVRFHLECVRSKMGVATIVQAVARAIRINII